jgi:hypothetical protein
MMAACGSHDGRSTAATTGDSGPLRVSLTGCIQPGALETKYVLENIQSGPNSAAQTPPSGPTNDALPEAMAEGSMVQLRSDNEPERHKYLGKQVSITGRLIDTGASTIGTTGAKGEPTQTGDLSMASAVGRHYSKKVRDEAGPIGHASLANGTAPIVHVDTIRPTGRGCRAGLAP